MNELAARYTALSRRSVIGTGLATAACGRIGSSPVNPARPVADIHAHLFNVADLPVAGFVKYVLLARFSKWPDWGYAFVDFAGNFAKRLTTSARKEAEAYPSNTDLDPQTFGRLAASHVEEIRMVTSATVAGGGADLIASYDSLLRELAAETGSAPAGLSGKSPSADVSTTDPVATAFRRAAQVSGESDTSVSLNPAHAIGEVSRSIGWIYLMMKSRAAHFDQYLRTMRPRGAPRGILVSLLVDYDYWLDDGPKQGSGMMDQIDTMNLMRRIFAPQADIRIFAGVCPLRLAIETALGTPRLYDSLVGAVEAGAVHGLKLYPPMGFRAYMNADLGNQDFNPGPQGRRTAFDRWQEAGQKGSLGRALDGALDEIYRFAAARSIPIIAHAGPGMGAGSVGGINFGQRADPQFWTEALRRYNVRLNLGHLVNDARTFLKAVGKPPPYDRGVWALHDARKLLDRRPESAPDVYGDLAYMPELVGNREFAARFFRALRDIFAPGDPALERIAFGTDWIMYAREPNSDRFLSSVEQGMQDAGYSPLQVENVLWNNTRRFLGIS